MSRKFLDDQIELKLERPTGGSTSVSALPSQTTTGYDKGHLVLDPGTALRFTNEGNSDGNLFLSSRYNALILDEPLTTLPHIPANQTASFNTSVSLVGTNVADSTAALNSTTGGITLTTTTTSGDQSIIGSNTNSAWGSVNFIADNGLVFETQLVTAAAITSQTIHAGLKLTNTPTIATDDDQAIFRYQNGVNSGKWQVNDSTGGVDNTLDSGVTVVASTAYLLQIRILKDRKPRYYINGKKVATGKALTAATNLKPFVGVTTGTTAAKSITVRHLRITLPRNPIP